jgi:hypothetical protein
LIEFLQFLFYYLKIQLKEGTLEKKHWAEESTGKGRLLSGRVSEECSVLIVSGGLKRT